VRIIAATNKDLRSMVKMGTFREDLFYRLKIIEIHFPPLRERPDDIPLLIEHFITMHSKKLGKQVEDVDQQLLRLLQRYPYPGNIRELEGIIQRAVILAEQNHLSASDLPPEVLDTNHVASSVPGGERRVVTVAKNNDELKEAREEASSRAVAEVEKAFLQAALEANGGNITRAAKKTGMNRSLFQRLVKKHDIQVKKK
jgi:DNA-binding NtrC family response regulator